jgi:Ca2+-binding RTX toxin-like protein
MKLRTRRDRLRLESLEDRLALSTITFNGTELVYTAGAGVANDLTITRSGSTYTFTENAEVIQVGTTLSNTFQVDESAFDTMRLDLGDLGDTVTLELINRPTVVLGGGGDDTVHLLSNNRAVTVLGGDDNDTLHVGDPASGLESVLGQVVFNGGDQVPGGLDVLRVNDRGAPAVVNTRLDYTLTREQVRRVRNDFLAGTTDPEARLVYDNAESLVLYASDQADVIELTSTHDQTPVVINAGAGDDFVSAGDSMDVLRGRLTVNGQGDDDTLNVQDSGAAAGRTYVIDTDSVTQGSTTIDLAGLEALVIDAPDQANTFRVESASSAMSLVLFGGGQQDRVELLDGASTNAYTYAFSAASTLTRLFGQFNLVTAQISMPAVEQMLVQAGPGDDTFRMSPAFTPALTLRGGPGRDTIDYSAFTTAVEVNLATGRATGAPLIAGIENATGGAGNDILVGNALANRLEGRGGRDLLIGGRGGDEVFGGPGQDLMIASNTAFDGNIVALRAIRNMWASALSYLTRIDQLKNVGVGAGNAVRLNETTVRVGSANDDGARDRLHSQNATLGAGDRDWFWARLGSNGNSDLIPGRQTIGPFIEMVK